jgi:hypothetical protein
MIENDPIKVGTSCHFAYSLVDSKPSMTNSDDRQIWGASTGLILEDIKSNFVHFSHKKKKI